MTGLKCYPCDGLHNTRSGELLQRHQHFDYAGAYRMVSGAHSYKFRKVGPPPVNAPSAVTSPSPHTPYFASTPRFLVVNHSRQVCKDCAPRNDMRVFRASIGCFCVLPLHFEAPA